MSLLLAPLRIAAAVIGLISGNLNTGAPAPVYAAPFFDLVFAAFRRVENFLVDQAPTASPTQTSQSATGVITGALHATDPNGDPLRYTVTANPLHGTVNVAADGSYTYSPTTAFAHTGGTDIFTVTVDDSAVFHLFAPAGHTTAIPVSVTVAPVNHTPTVSVSAVHDTDGATSLTVTTSDTDADAVTTTATALDGHGTLTATATGYRYTPNADYAHGLSAGGATAAGIDSVLVTANDAHGGTTVALTDVQINGANAVPTLNVTVTPNGTAGSKMVTVSVADADTDVVSLTLSPVAHGAYLVNGEPLTDLVVNVPATPSGVKSSVIYVPDPSRPGAETISVTATDAHGGTAIATAATDAPTSTNHAPVITLSKNANTDGTFSITINASDADGNPITVSFAAPQHGTYTIAGQTIPAGATQIFASGQSATLIYVPNQTRPGTETVSFTGTDGLGGTSTASTTIAVNGQTSVVTTAITVGQSPAFVFLSPDGSRMYVINADGEGEENDYASTVSLVDTSTNSVIGSTLDLGRYPPGGGFFVGRGATEAALSFDGNTLFAVTDYAQGGVLNIIDTQTMSLVGAPIRLGDGNLDPTSIAVGPSGLVYVGGYRAVVVINATSLKTTTIPIAGWAKALAVSSDGTRLYTAEQEGYVSTISTISNSVIGTPIAVGPQYSGQAIAVSPDGTKVYVLVGDTVAHGSHITVINTITQAKLEVAVPFVPHSMVLSPDGNRLYVSSLGGALQAIDTATNSTLGRPLSVGNESYALAFSEDGKRLYATSFSNNSVSFIDTATNALVGSARAVDGPLNLAVNPFGDHVYSVNTLGNTVTAIDTGTTNLPTSALNPEELVLPSTSWLYDHLRIRTDTTLDQNNGVYIETVRSDSDKQDRLIVYIGGTDPHDGLLALTGQSIDTNLDSISAYPKDYQVQVIANAVANCPQCVGVMLVGYSQGGLDAQNLARAAQSSPLIDTVVTFAAPYLQTPSPGKATVYLQDQNDPVTHLLDLTVPSNRPGTVYSGTSGVGTFLSAETHTNPLTYEILGAAFDRDTDPKFDAVRKNIADYAGTVIAKTKYRDYTPPGGGGGGGGI